MNRLITRNMGLYCVDMESGFLNRCLATVNERFINTSWCHVMMLMVFTHYVGHYVDLVYYFFYVYADDVISSCYGFQIYI